MPECRPAVLWYNLVPDQRINTLDFDAFAAQWLTFDRRYYSP
jgi:hypothetical protein